MTAYNAPPGVTLEEPPLSVGSPDVLVAQPGTSTSFAFTDPPGVTVDDGGETSTPTTPTTGQLWPRGAGQA